jgi:plasmid stabilization system protein ParE
VRTLRYLRSQRRYAQAESVLRSIPEAVIKRAAPERRIDLLFWFARTLHDRRLNEEAKPYRQRLRTACDAQTEPHITRVCADYREDLLGTECRSCVPTPYRLTIEQTNWMG